MPRTVAEGECAEEVHFDEQTCSLAGAQAEAYQPSILYAGPDYSLIIR